MVTKSQISFGLFSKIKKSKKTKKSQKLQIWSQKKQTGNTDYRSTASEGDEGLTSVTLLEGKCELGIAWHLTTKYCFTEIAPSNSNPLTHDYDSEHGKTKQQP